MLADLEQARLLGSQIGEIVADVVDGKIASLLARIEKLEARDQEVKYLGTWEQREYRPGNFVTYQGSVWACMETTTQRPGSGGPQWVLAVKRGQDARGG
jgi:hypothetical protein